MRITNFDETHFETICQQFLGEYRSPKQNWSIETVRSYVRAHVEDFPDLFLVAQDDTGAYIGCIFGQSYWHYEGKFAHVSSMQVNDANRGQGVAKKLLGEFAARARSQEMAGILMQVDEDKSYPRDWYTKVGFHRMNWMEYCARWNELHM